MALDAEDIEHWWKIAEQVIEARKSRRTHGR